LTLLPVARFPVVEVDEVLLELALVEPALRFIPAAAASCITAETDFPNCVAI
jgi:hypothetical protein